MNIPNYLNHYEELYLKNPREAAVQWFRDAKYGLFLHYGLYSILEKGEWVQLTDLIPVAEYAKLESQFSAKNFNADAIAQFAQNAGMKYINFTTRHHDSFSLFETAENDFHSVNSPCGRDLVKELAEACDKYSLGFCLYYSHGRDWRHPHAANNNQFGGSARPEYPNGDPSFKTGNEHDLNIYLDFMKAQITELLTNYGSIACIWLDGIGTPMSGDHTLFKCQELYDLIHDLQPQVLVSYKQGLLGTEDFYAPEHNAVSKNDGKPMEICTTMAELWGYNKHSGPHKTADDVLQELADAAKNDCNLLLNIGPLPDGSLDPSDVQTLLKVGEILKSQ